MKPLKLSNPRLQRYADKLTGWKEVAVIVLLAGACVVAWMVLRGMK